MIRIVSPFYTEFETVKPALRALRHSEIPHAVQPVQGPLIAQNRNHGVKFAGGVFSHVLFVDADICFTVQDLRHALSLDKPILGLPYLTHRGDGSVQAGTWKDPRGVLGTRYTSAEKGLQPVDFCGAGFLLVQAHVLRAMEYPWFRHDVVELEDGTKENMPEDAGFCVGARRAGFQVWVDFNCPVFHRLRIPAEFNVDY
jgi:hypothetical protein